MSISTTTELRGLYSSTFSASLVATSGAKCRLTVSGQALGDYRTQQVKLTRATHQENEHTLVLDIQTTMSPVESFHPEFERVFPLQYEETPAAHRYTQVLIINGQHILTIAVTDAH